MFPLYLNFDDYSTNPKMKPQAICYVHSREFYEGGVIYPYESLEKKLELGLYKSVVNGHIGRTQLARLISDRWIIECCQ